MCILLGDRGDGDTREDAERLAGKIFAPAHLPERRGEGSTESLLDTGGEALVVSQFTLIADRANVKRELDPSFSKGPASKDVAEPLYEALLRRAPSE